MKRAAALALVLSLACGCRRPAPVLGELPDFQLTAVTPGLPAAPFTRKDLSGRVWVAGFVFTRCLGPCPALSATMARLQSRLPPEVGLLTFTVDPDHDDAGRLAAYARKLGAEQGRWLFVTGPKARLTDLLTRGFKVAAVEDPKAPEGQRVTHSTRFVLVDRQARLRGYFDAEEPGLEDKLGEALSSLGG